MARTPASKSKAVRSKAAKASKARKLAADLRKLKRQWEERERILAIEDEELRTRLIRERLERVIGSISGDGKSATNRRVREVVLENLDRKHDRRPR
jgi:hypothetical protein